jgi:alkanesulfonate monooxygenase SsuD/methylene tetrahydromethanopterin reductase-like flavin-dependent oxidoreductase (luciferase family)
MKHKKYWADRFRNNPLRALLASGSRTPEAGRLEQAGYRTTWTDETVGGKDPLVQLALLLPATERMTFGTGIANIRARAPRTAHAATAMLAEAYPGRLELVLVAGYPQQATVVGRGSAVRWPRCATITPAPAAAYPRIVAANGPKMVALAGELADGALPAGMPPAFTAWAREALGPDKLLVVAMSVITDTADREAAKPQPGAPPRLRRTWGNPR